MGYLRNWTAALLLLCAASGADAADSHALAIDVAHSHMTVSVFKQGLFAFAADNHEIDAPIVSGSVDAAAGKVEIAVDASKMTVLDPKLAADRRAQVQANMLGSQVLDVGHYPKISFASTKIAVDGAQWDVSGDLTLHGQTHPIVLHVTSVDPTHFTGSVMVRQTDFGITPIKIIGGAVTVKNDVKVDFTIVLASK